MAINFERALGIHQKALDVYGRRTEVIASNIANADTPGYQAQDIDFRSVLAAQGNGANLALSQTSQGASLNNKGQVIKSGAVDDIDTVFRQPLQSSIDGNTVEVDREQAIFADNSVRYQATLQFLGGRFSSMKEVIRGGR